MTKYKKKRKRKFVLSSEDLEVSNDFRHKSLSLSLKLQIVCFYNITILSYIILSVQLHQHPKLMLFKHKTKHKGILHLCKIIMSLFTFKTLNFSSLFLCRNAFVFKFTKRQYLNDIR